MNFLVLSLLSNLLMIRQPHLQSRMNTEIASKESSIKELQDEIKDIESIKTSADNFVANLKNILA